MKMSYADDLVAPPEDATGIDGTALVVVFVAAASEDATTVDVVEAVDGDTYVLGSYCRVSSARFPYF